MYKIAVCETGDFLIVMRRRAHSKLESLTQRNQGYKLTIHSLLHREYSHRNIFYMYGVIL